MNVFDFKKRFGQAIDEEEVKRAFVNHINFKLLEMLDDEAGRLYYDSSPGKKLFDAICLYMNRNPSQVVRDYNSRGLYNMETQTPRLRYLTSDDFEQTLLVTEAAYHYFLTSDVYRKEGWLRAIDFIVSAQLEAPLSLGVSWVAGKFIPEGAKELQEVLVEDNLLWLSEFPETQKLFTGALNDYASSRSDEIKRKNAMSNSFQAVEQFARTFLQTDKAFDNIFNELMDSLSLHPHWKQICNRWNELAKEFARHSGRDGTMPSQEDVEAFIYLSGLLLRLMIQKHKNNI